MKRTLELHIRLVRDALPVAALILFMDAVVRPLTAGGRTLDANSTEGSLFFQLLALSVYGLTVLIVAPFPKRYPQDLGRHKLLLTMAIVPLLSTLWSVYPSVTLRRSCGLVGETLFACYIAYRYTPERFLRILGVGFGIVGLFSLAFAIGLPGVGVHHGDVHSGLWRGAFTHKNMLGKNMALGTIVFVLLAMTSRAWRWAYLGCAALTALLLVMSGSKTSLLVVGIFVLSLPALGILRIHSGIFSIVLGSVVLGAIAATYWLVQNMDNLLTMLDRDVSLTGRVPIWQLAIERGMQRPWLGSGYRAFWVSRYVLGTYWEGSGHNDFLDQWLELGFLGLSLLILSLATMAFRVVRNLRRGGDITAIWHGAFMIYVLTMAFTESFFLAPNGLVWFIFTVNSCHASPSFLNAGRRPPATTHEPLRAAQSSRRVPAEGLPFSMALTARNLKR